MSVRRLAGLSARPDRVSAEARRPLDGAIVRRVDAHPIRAVRVLKQRVHCTACPASWEIEIILTVVGAGDPNPPCFECGGAVKTSMVLFGEPLSETTFDRAIQVAASADAVLAVGSTLTSTGRRSRSLNCHRGCRSGDRQPGRNGVR